MAIHNISTRIGRLNLKLIVAIGAILIVFMSLDTWFSIKSSRDTALREIERWSVLLAESVRVSMNTLMKEDKMDARFTMFDSMRKEIPGLEKVRVIRGEKVNELFLNVREKKEIPREQKAIESYHKKIEDLNAKLKSTQNDLERKDIESEISDAQSGIASAEKKIQELRTIKTDPRELPSGGVDRKVLDSGKPMFLIDGDKLRVWAPYVAQNTCGAAGGCHVGVEDGNVLGAVNMEFSLAAINSEIRKNAIFAAVAKMLLGAVIIGCLVLMINIVVIKNIRLILDSLNKLGSGDLRERINIRGKDEMQDLAQGFNAVAERFSVIITQIRKVTGDVASSTAELSASSSKIAQGTVSEKEKTQSLADASYEMNSAALEIAKTISGIAEAAEKSNNTAENGKQVVIEALAGMGKVAETSKLSSTVIASLSERSEQIGRVTLLISEIADQTNLLALNAAIEAARAGEQGRGFAVVADEVRKLAERSAKATKDIAEMIAHIQDDTHSALSSMEKETRAVSDTMRMTRDAEGVLHAIVTHAGEVSEMAQQIAAAAEELSTSSDTISADISDVAGITANTSADAQLIASTSREIAQNATYLMELVSTFKV